MPSVWPPSITSICPVMYEASSDARNNTALAMSRGYPKRPSGMVLR